MRNWLRRQRGPLIALGALLRRDLSAGRRGTTVAVARFVAVALSGSIAIFALVNARDFYGNPAQSGTFGWLLAWALALFTLLMLPVLSLQVLRQDRDSGRLELLLLAGLSPRLLALGRWLSTFLLLESLLLDAVPAMAVFTFFGAPTPGELGWGLLALTGWNATLAGLAVYLSAAIRRTGPLIVSSVCLLFAIVGLSIYGLVVAEDKGQVHDTLAAAPMVLFEMTARRLDIGAHPPLDVQRHVLGAALFVGLGAVLGLLAGERLAVQARPAKAPTKPSAWRRRRGLGAPGPVRAWPLTWLLQRNATSTRPLALALAAPLPMLLMGLAFEAFRRRGDTSLGWRDLLEPAVLVSFASLYWLTGLLIGLFSAALQAARAKERNEWDSLLATGRRGRRIVLDLLAGPSAATLVLLALSSLLFLAASIVEPSAGVFGLLVSINAALAGSALLVLGLGTIAGLVGRTQASTLGLSLLLLVLAAILGPIGADLLGGTLLGIGLDTSSRVSAFALVAVVLVPLQFFLLDRSRRRPGAGRLFFELLLFASLLSAPLVQGLLQASTPSEAFLMLALSSAALGLPLLAVTLRRPDFWLGRTG